MPAPVFVVPEVPSARRMYKLRGGHRRGRGLAGLCGEACTRQCRGSGGILGAGGAAAWPGFEPTTQPPNQDEYRWAISLLIPAGHAPVRERYTS